MFKKRLKFNKNCQIRTHGGSDLTVSSRHGDGGSRTHRFTVLNRLPIPFGYNGKHIKNRLPSADKRS